MIAAEEHTERLVASARRSGVHYLNLSERGLTSLPDTIGELVELRELNLHKNRLTTLPDSIGRLTNLRLLDLVNNKLTGIPTTIGNLNHLEELHLYHNQLASLPVEVGQLSELQKLDLEDNLLTSLPEVLGQLRALRFLRLEQNRLNSLPEEIGQILRLEMLTLGRNELKSMPTALCRLTGLSLLFLHGNPALDLPAEVLGAEINRPGRPAKPSDVVYFFFGATIDRKREADDMESQARSLLARNNVDHVEIRDVLTSCAQVDPSRASRLGDEFGFLYDFDSRVDRSWKRDSGEKAATRWRRFVWRILSERNTQRVQIVEGETRPTPLSGQKREGSPATQTVQRPEARRTQANHLPLEPTDQMSRKAPDSVVEPVGGQGGRTPRPPRAQRPLTSEQKGEQLEQAVVGLLEQFFAIDTGQTELILKKLHRQKRGAQFGHDISFECSVRWNQDVRCHVECKNVQGQLKPSDVLEKITEYDLGDKGIDHWILISPHAVPSNKLNELLAAWESLQRYPFTIQVWSPDVRIHEFFGLRREVYDTFYQRADMASHPEQWSAAKRVCRRRPGRSTHGRDRKERKGWQHGDGSIGAASIITLRTAGTGGSIGRAHDRRTWGWPSGSWRPGWRSAGAMATPGC